MDRSPLLVPSSQILSTTARCTSALATSVVLITPCLSLPVYWLLVPPRAGHGRGDRRDARPCRPQDPQRELLDPPPAARAHGRGVEPAAELEVVALGGRRRGPVVHVGGDDVPPQGLPAAVRVQRERGTIM